MRHGDPKGHPSEAELLLALEGELSARRVADVRRHLELCWSCLAATQQLKNGICAFVTYNEQWAKLAERPPDEWRAFSQRLQQVVDECDRSSSISKFSAAPSRPFWLSACSAAMVLLLLVADPLGHPRILSAEEFLRHLATSRRTPGSQSILITVGRKSMTRYLPDPRALATQTPGPEELEFQRVFLASGLSWPDSLDPKTFIDWREQLTSKQDSVTQFPDRVELRTTTTEGPVHEAALIVSAGDWHPVREEFTLQNDTRLTICEVQPAAVQPKVESPKALHPVRKATQFPIAPMPFQISNAEFLRAELEARAALHSVQADLGEPLELSKSVTGKVAIKGTLSTPEKLASLHAALAGIASVDDQISPETAAPAPQDRALPAHFVAASPAHRPIFREQLVKLLPDDAERTALVNSILADSQDLLVRVWALKKLADRYMPTEENQLDVQSSALLRTLVKDHARELSKTVAQLQSSISLLAVKSPEQDKAIKGEAKAPDWQSKSQLVFRLIKEGDHLCKQLVFAPDDASDIAVEVRQLEQVYDAIQSELSDIEPQGGL
jgi:hypothetical protein